MDRGVKFRIAMALFALLGVGEWLTLDGKFRKAALLLLCMFAFFTALKHVRRRIEEKADGSGA
jgi:type II secretory pathway component PulJ